MILKEPLGQPPNIRGTGHNDLPPPYSKATGEPSDRGSVNKIVVATRHQDIIGTYYVDPDLAVPDCNTLKGRSKRSKHHSQPNATFRTKRGVIDVNLVIKGRPLGTSKAIVDLFSRKSDIAVNLLSMQPSKHISLEAKTRAGNVVVLLPRSFCGALQLRSGKGRLNYLPAFSREMRIMNSTKDEALIFFGDASTALTGPSTSDYCKLTTNHGKIILGISGEDTYVPEKSFWSKLGDILSGGYDRMHDRQLPGMVS